MPIKRRPGKAHVSGELTEVEMLYLRDERLPPDAGFEADSAWWSMERDDGTVFREGRPSVREMWAAMGADIVAEWVQDAPGTRPSTWWRCDAPEPRRRLDDGPGKPGWPDRLRYGKPTGWSWPVAWPPGAVIVGGPPECDPNDPPVYESQAEYLQRLGLLLPGEAERLTAEDFEPEAIRPHVTSPGGNT